MKDSWLYPSNICFTHDSIKANFRDGRSLRLLFTALVSGEITVDKVQKIVCVSYQGKYWVIHGNRRLFLFKILEKVGIIKRVKVGIKQFEEEFFRPKFTTENGGTWVYCRSNPNLAEELCKVIFEVCLIHYRPTDFDFWRRDNVTHVYAQTRHQHHGNVTAGRDRNAVPDVRIPIEEARHQPDDDIIATREQEEANNGWWNTWCVIL